MAFSIDAILGNVIVSRLIGFLFDNFSNHFSTNGGNSLESFIRTLSSEFTHRVENVVRAAFSNQNFVEIKTNVNSAATALRTYTATQGADRFQLDAATGYILNARSRLFVESERLTSSMTRQEELNIADPSEKGTVVLGHIRALEAAMSALQAIAALDLTILSTRVELFPTLNVEIIERVNEYTTLARELKKVYELRQSFRTWIKTVLDIARVSPEGGSLVGFKVIYYKDGAPVDSRIRTGFYPGNFAQWEQEKVKIKRELQERCMRENQRLYVDAQNRNETAPGNLQEAISVWESVRSHFQTA